MQLFQNIYFDKKNHRFSVFAHEKGTLSFVYWHVLKKHGFTMLSEKTFVEGQTTTSEVNPMMRGLRFSSIQQTSFQQFQNCSYKLYENQDFNQEELLLLTSKNCEIPIFIGCQFSEIEIQKHAFKSSLAFLDCTFKDNFRLLQSKIYGDIWMPNCTFNKHFSLKETIIDGDIHLESSDFSGFGGASFRGIHATNLYIDLGVQGGDDLFWLNEMVIEETLSIGGKFYNELQILGRQDIDEDCGVESCIGDIRIGVELYEFENANRTYIASALKLNGFKNTGIIHMNNLKAQKLHCMHVSGEVLLMNNVNTESDMIIRDCQFSAPYSNKSAGIKAIDCSVSRHLKIQDNRFSGMLDLNGSAVSENSYIENNHCSEASKLDLRRFTSSRVLISPETFLTEHASFRLLRPKEFSILHHASREELGDQYCSLKNWLADAGRLELEDMAYFHMRQCYQRNVLLRLLFGGVFGWGVRLSNIGVSCVALILLFSAIFTLVDEKIVILKALSLSTQGFISSFFGKWDDYQPEGLISSLVTFESVLGVLFITVFVGAYIRKLLR